MELHYNVLTHSGFFVDERLLDKGIYTTVTPVLHKFNETIDDVKDMLRKYHSLIGAHYAIDEALNNLSKCKWEPVLLKTN